MLFFINYNNPQPLPTIFCSIHSSIILRDYFKRAIFSRHGLLEIHVNEPNNLPFFFTHNSLKTNWGSQWPEWRYNIALNWECVKIFFLPTLWRNSAAVTLSPKHICGGSAPHRHKDSEHSISSKLHVQWGS